MSGSRDPGLELVELIVAELLREPSMSGRALAVRLGVRKSDCHRALRTLQAAQAVHLSPPRLGRPRKWVPSPEGGS